MDNLTKYQHNTPLYKEVESFLNNLNFIKVGNRIFAVGKDIPCLFEIRPDDFISWKDRAQISTSLINDFILLKEFAYIPPAKIPQWQRHKQIRAVMSFHISHDCNMDCRYCFLKDALPRSKIKLMSPELARKAIVFFLNRISTKKASIIFIGGEPLLNLPAIKAAIEETKKFPQYNIRFSIVTNGTLLNKQTALFLQENKIRIIISYDGIKEENDRNRPLKDGRGSSDLIINNIYLLKQLNVDIWSVKITISEDSPYSIIDFVQAMMKLPIHPRKIAIQYQHGGQIAAPRKNLSVKLNLLDQAKEWIKKGRRFGEIPLNGSEWMFDFFIQPPKRMVVDNCGLDDNKILVTPTGDLYMCDIVVNKEEFRLGNIKQGIDEDKLENLRKRYFISPDYCKDCWIKYFCDRHCLFVHNNKARLAASCASLRAEFKKALEIFPELNFQDILSICFPVGKPEGSEEVVKLLSISYGLRSILREKTKALKPLNVIPYGQNYVEL
jgi:uncharacterized protein